MTQQRREIGPIGTVSRLVVGLFLLYIAFVDGPPLADGFEWGLRWYDVVVGAVALPAIMLGFGLAACRYAPGDVRFHGCARDVAKRRGARRSGELRASDLSVSARLLRAMSSRPVVGLRETITAHPDRGGVVAAPAAARRRSPAIEPGFHSGWPPRNKGRRYPADPPRVEGIAGSCARQETSSRTSAARPCLS